VTAMVPGDIIWQSRLPGGVCLFIEEVTIENTVHDPATWTKTDEPVYRILHPTEGLIEDPSYCYMTLEEEEIYYRRRLVYELKKAGRLVPDWLQQEVDDDESRRSHQ